MIEIIVQISVLLSLFSGTYSFQVRYCNRGFCYTKQFKQDPTHHLYSGSHQERRKSALNFCTDNKGSVTDCALLDILGLSMEDYEGIQDVNSAKMSTKVYKATVEETNEEKTNVELHGGHIPWRERPKRGMCYDNKLSYAFDCNLIDVLDEGLLLIEDLRAGGIFVAQPKTGFTTRQESKSHSHLKPLETPNVMLGSEPVPTEDFRTNVQMNLEGM